MLFNRITKILKKDWNLEVHGFRFDLDERRVNAPMGWYILVYLLLHRERNASYGELASHLWEETPTQTVANKVRRAIYRFRRSYEGLADEYMTISEGTGYGLNPYYQITTSWTTLSDGSRCHLDDAGIFPAGQNIYTGRECFTEGFVYVKRLFQRL